MDSPILGIGTVVVEVFTSFSFQTHSDPFHTYSADADAMRHDVRVTTINNTVSDRILKMFFFCFEMSLRSLNETNNNGKVWLWQSNNIF